MPTENTNTDEVVRDEYGFDENGIHTNGTEFNDAGFDQHHLHRDTDTEFDESGRTINGTRYNVDGYDVDGYDVEGYDRNGYDEDGYDSDGWDRDGYNTEGYDADGYDCDGQDSCGNTRCDNGDCDDDYCDCRTRGSDELLDSDACVLEETRWCQYRYKRTAQLVAFEFECIAHDCANDGAERLMVPFDEAYDELIGHTAGCGSIAKHDGSLPTGKGVEFVTVPMLLDEHRRVLAKAFPGGRLGGGHVSAWNHTKCGMHVHLNRRSMGNLTLGKLLCFMHQSCNRSFHIDIAGRETTYAKFQGHRSFVSNGLPVKADHGEKYSALNIKPHTVEFRIFRPSTQLPTILKNLCYCLAAREFCVSVSAMRSSITWQEFLKWLGTTDARLRYRELDSWLRNRQSDYGMYYRAHAKPLPKPKPLGAA
jgi:hypothetical protein